MKYYTDGFMINCNPSPVGGGYTVINEIDELIVRKDILKRGLTCNEAEILGILFSLKYAKAGDSVSTDSMCCLTWVHQGRSKARPDLGEVLKECKNLKIGKSINLMWEGREFNKAGIYNEKTGTHNTLF